MNSLLHSKLRRGSSDDNMIPLINIVFLLLIFFMVAGQMRAGLVGDITLPDANLETPTPPKAIAIQIDRSGQTYLFGTPTSIEDIQQQLQTLPAEQPLNIALQADRELKAAQLDTLLAALRGLSNATTSLYTKKGAN
ncbi:ExbD/TolR family protein [Spongiibacter tropicus]|uniref:ExbD/TolR family protein n=1 Tax=Spongiibacter tropicus TaxID=454602 RepID=UPI003A991495